VVVIAGALLNACKFLLEKGIHAPKISEGFQTAYTKAMEIIDSISKEIDLSNRESLINNAIRVWLQRLFLNIQTSSHP
jgi:chaperonin GroEL (HSP60 family)